MRMRRTHWMIMILVLAGSLAGCLGGGDETDEDNRVDPGDDTDPVLLSYTGCEEHLAVVPVPHDEIAAGLPAGFEPVAYEHNLGLPATGALATGVVITYACDLDGTHAAEAFVLAAVEVPEEFRVDDADLYVYVYVVLTDHPVAQEVYAAWGAPVETAHVELVAMDLGPARSGAATASQEGGVGLQLDTLTTSDGQAPAGTAIAFFGEDGNLAAMRVDWTAAATYVGEATIRFPGNVPFDPLSTFHGLGVHNLGEDYDINVTLWPLV